MIISWDIETSRLLHWVFLIEVHCGWIKLWMLFYHLCWSMSSFIRFLEWLESRAGHRSPMSDAHRTVTGDSSSGSPRLILTAFYRFLFAYATQEPSPMRFPHLHLLKLFDVSSDPLRSTHSILLIYFLWCEIKRCKDLWLHFWDTWLAGHCLSGDGRWYSDWFFWGACISFVICFLSFAEPTYVFTYFLTWSSL